MSDGPLQGQRVLVTGGAKRIGREIALTLARAGADVAITYLHSTTDAEATRDELSEIGVRALAVQCDVREEASVGTAVGSALSWLGGLDLLVNNAGIFETARLEEVTVAQWDAMHATNTRGPFLVARATHSWLKASRGRIVNVGSLGGLKAWATHGHYCASKAGLHMLSEVMAKAWAPEISVNTVAPGMITFGEAGLGDKTPMGRDGTAAEVAAAVLFFATGPHFVTGQMLAVAGGLAL